MTEFELIADRLERLEQGQEKMKKILSGNGVEVGFCERVRLIEKTQAECIERQKDTPKRWTQWADLGYKILLIAGIVGAYLIKRI